MRASVLATAWCAVLGLACPVAAAPASAAGDAPTAESHAIADLALQPGGVMAGQLVDVEGRALGQREVTLVRGGQRVATTRTDPRGRFAFPGLRGGVYQVAAAGRSSFYRVWSPDAAPPAANRAALLVAGQGPVRGQGGLPVPRGWNRLTALGPYLVGFAGSAVAIPLSIGDLEAAPVSP